MQNTIKTPLYIFLLLVLSLTVSAAEINERNTFSLETSKQTGLESRVTPVVATTATGYTIDLFYDPTLSVLDKDKLENNNIDLSGYTLKKKTKKSDRLTIEIDHKDKKDKTEKEKKTSSYIKYGSNTLLMEESSYYTLENSGQIWYISKAGFHLSNVPEDSYAQMHYDLVFANQSFNSHAQIWEWEINNGTDYVSLTASTYIPEYDINWTMKYELDDDSYFLNVTSDTTNRALSYTQVFAHHDFNISVNDIEDDLLYNKNRYKVDTDTVTGTDDYHKIEDPITAIEIEIQLQEPLPFTLSGGHLEIEQSSTDPFTVAWNDGAGAAHVLGDNFNFTTQTTASTTFVDAGSGSFVLNQTTPVTFYISFVAEKTLGTNPATQFEWNFLVDGVAVKNITTNLPKNQPDTIFFLYHSEEDVMTAGEHNFTVQHAATGGGTLETDHLLVSAHTMQFQNFTSLNHAFKDINHTLADSTLTQKNNFTFVSNEDGKTLVIYFDGAVSTNLDTTVNYASNLDGEFSHYSTETVDAGESKLIHHIHVYENISAGAHTVSVYGFRSGTATVSFDGNIQILDTHSDELDLNHDDTTFMSKTFTDNGAFQHVANTTLLIEEANDYVSFNTFSIQRTAGGTAEIDFLMRVDGTGDTRLWTTTLNAVTQVNNIGLFHAFQNLSEGNHTVSLWIRPEVGLPGSFNVYNFSMLSYETIDIDSFTLPADNPPDVSLVSPPDSAVLTNQVTVTHECTFTDNNLDYVALYHNSTGTFTEEIAVQTSETSFNYLFNETYTLNSSILWGCWANDTIGQETFSENRTFTNPFVAPPTFTIELINPINNSIDTDGIVNFRFDIDGVTNATLYHNLSGSFDPIETIETINGLNNFTQITFTQNATLQWFVGVTDFNNSFHILTLNITVDPDAAEALIGEFSVRTCPAGETGTSLFIGIMLFFALGLIFATLVSGAGMFAMFAGFMVIILSWYIAPCIGILSFAVGGFGIVLIIWSVTAPSRIN